MAFSLYQRHSKAYVLITQTFVIHHLITSRLAEHPFCTSDITLGMKSVVHVFGVVGRQVCERQVVLTSILEGVCLTLTICYSVLLLLFSHAHLPVQASSLPPSSAFSLSIVIPVLLYLLQNPRPCQQEYDRVWIEGFYVKEVFP
ncbi:hypothetical protein B0H65DRAFT_340636 [Neurospora tetraspora]|uniref:Uncharacterized protein n=1 Tax=Neurospora tetraspora TaxID=94610 RepID=A0AAE0J180_9PEZI|nr:hypothetical protein B0H65DRAFT_340636 [Neurospora tetraspora]